MFAFVRVALVIVSLHNNKTLRQYPHIIQEMLCSKQFQTAICQKITFLSMHDLYLLALSASKETTIASKTGYYLSEAPAIKPETKAAWLKEAAKQETNLLSKE